MGIVIRNLVSFMNGWFIAATALGLFIVLVYTFGLSLKWQLPLFWIAVPIVYIAILLYNILVVGTFKETIGYLFTMAWAVYGAYLSSSKNRGNLPETRTNQWFAFKHLIRTNEKYWTIIIYIDHTNSWGKCTITWHLLKPCFCFTMWPCIFRGIHPRSLRIWTWNTLVACYTCLRGEIYSNFIAGGRWWVSKWGGRLIEGLGKRRWLGWGLACCSGWRPSVNQRSAQVVY